MNVFIEMLNICSLRRVNIFRYREALKRSGHKVVESIGDADKVLVWTCAVRRDFHDNSIAVLKGFESDGHKVVAAGCLPSINPDLIRDEFNGELIHYNNDSEEFRAIFGGSLDDAPYPVAEAPILIPLERYKAENPGMKIGNDDQYIKIFISEGCTKVCTYCTEVRAFPPYKSYPIDKLVSKSRELIGRTGVNKIALFGDDIGAYGKDCGSNIIELLDALVDIGPSVQISLKQIHPRWWMEYFSDLKKLIDDAKIFQILAPIQSANSRILKIMGRGYSSKDLDRLFDSVKGNSGLELETHVIAGFPSETADEWDATVRFICQHKFRYVMGNIYMPGPGTAASKMSGQIGEKEKERRILSGAAEMEKHGTVVSHSLSWRAKEHLTHELVNFIEL